MAGRPAARELLSNRRYLRFALPGAVLIVISAVFWGQGWWTTVVQCVGVGLIVLPFPTRRADRPDAGPDPTPGSWTGAR